MPGPSNSKKRRAQQKKKEKTRRLGANDTAKDHDRVLELEATESDPPDLVETFQAWGESIKSYHEDPALDVSNTESFQGSPEADNEEYYRQRLVCSLPLPFVDDPGNGLRLHNMRAFLESGYAPPPSFDDPKCARYVAVAIFEALSLILPEELALTLWYNKTRKTSRVCPACQRTYRTGDKLGSHIKGSAPELASPYTYLEQEISGICTSMCFIVTSYNYARVMRSIWGRTEQEINDEIWAYLCGPGEGDVDDLGLGLYTRLAKTESLGLSTKFFS